MRKQVNIPLVITGALMTITTVVLTGYLLTQAPDGSESTVLLVGVAGALGIVLAIKLLVKLQL